MGIEQLIPNDIETNTRILIKAYWRRDLYEKGYSDTEQQKIIIDEAIACGITTPLPPPANMGEILFCIANKDEKGIITVAIGKTPPTSNSEVWGVIYDGDIFESNIEVIAQLCHVIMLTRGNPLELHFRLMAWSETPAISIEGIERVKTPSQVGEYTKELSGLLPRLGDLFDRTKGGRPKGPAPSENDFEKMKKDCQFFLEKGYTQEKIIERLGIRDTKTLRTYMKIWGLNPKSKNKKKITK